MTSTEIVESLREQYPELLLADGFDGALIGVVDGACRSPVACYDYARCIEILMGRDGMEEGEACEYMDFNVTGAYMGELTPLFLHDWRREICGDSVQRSTCNG
jgi:hypothetical protein